MNEKLCALLDAVRRTAVQVNKTADDAAYCVAERASRMLSQAKRNVRTAELDREVDRRLRELGQMLYNTHTGDPTDSEALLEKLREVDGLKAQIDALKAQPAREDRGGSASPACPACGGAVRPGDRYCRECGRTL